MKWIPENVRKGNLHVTETIQAQCEISRITQRPRARIFPIEISGICTTGRTHPGAGRLAKDSRVLMGGHGSIDKDVGSGAECCQGHAIEQDPEVFLLAERSLPMGGKTNVIEVFHVYRFGHKIGRNRHCRKISPREKRNPANRLLRPCCWISLA
jgi:hypothetical protein